MIKINRKECGIRRLARGNSSTAFEEHFVRGALRTDCDPLDLEIKKLAVGIRLN